MIDELRELLGDGKVSTMAEVLEEHGTDRWNFSHLPEVVVFAECRDDVVTVMKFANERLIPVTTRGAGVGYVGGCVPIEGGIALSVARMKSLVEIAPEDGVVVTQPGVILKDLQDAVSELGWYYPPDPASLKECSIGGNLATNAGGPRCLKYGVTKNYVLGLEVVLASGEVLHVGGRCHKNKTGFDLLHLFVGSEGMLGVITEATLRIIPHPQTRAMLTATFPEFVDVAGAVQAVLNAGHLPSALEITDEFTLKAARAYLGEDSMPPGKAHLIVEIDGRAKAVAGELEELQEVLNGAGALSSELHGDEEACEKVWQLRRDFSYSLRATGLTKLNEDIVVPRSKLVELASFAAGLEERTGIPVACFGHAGDGNIHTNLMVEGYDDPDVREQADAALDVLFTWVLENGGVITGEHGVGLAKKRWIKEALGEAGFTAHLTVKDAFDPNRILNPGKFLD
ncbi:FAD-binding protein [bacterium]|nr:FAD-binding protein [bacterium]